MSREAGPDDNLGEWHVPYLDYYLNDFIHREQQMDQIKVGQELEFIETAHVDARTIEKGTHVRVGFVIDGVLEPKVTVVVLGKEPPETLTLPRHALMVHCVAVSKGA